MVVSTARGRVYRAIYAAREISRQDLAGLLGMSLPTILQSTKSLMRDGLVRTAGQFDSTGGRKAEKLAAVGEVRNAFGLEITRHYVTFVFADLLGNVLAQDRIYEAFRFGDPYFRRLGGMVRDFLAKARAPRERLLGGGIALPGSIDSAAGRLIFSQALELRGAALETFSRHIDAPCLFINDAAAAGRTELAGAAARPLTIYISLNDSVGGAVFIHGRLYRGEHFRCGEFAHTALRPGGKECSCGKRGCVDAYLSAWVLARETGGRLDAFFRRLEEKDAAVKKVWNRYLDDLALFVSGLSAVFDGALILGGYVGGCLEAYMPDLYARLAAAGLDAGMEHIKPCRFQLKAAALGAAMLQAERYIAAI
jgi:predicted NBD/HSP70 family sugar kinase